MGNPYVEFKVTLMCELPVFVLGCGSPVLYPRFSAISVGFREVSFVVVGVSTREYRWNEHTLSVESCVTVFLMGYPT